MFVCTRPKNGIFSPRGEHFLRNSFFSVLRTFSVYSYIFFLTKILFHTFSISSTAVF